MILSSTAVRSDLSVVEFVRLPGNYVTPRSDVVRQNLRRLGFPFDDMVAGPGGPVGVFSLSGQTFRQLCNSVERAGGSIAIIYGPESIDPPAKPEPKPAHAGAVYYSQMTGRRISSPDPVKPADASTVTIGIDPAKSGADKSIPAGHPHRDGFKAETPAPAESWPAWTDGVRVTTETPSTERLMAANREQFRGAVENIVARMEQGRAAKTRFRAVLARVRYRDGWVFRVGRDGMTLFLEVGFPAACADTGEASTQWSRKWMLDPLATDADLLRTALKAVLATEEHEAREAFTFEGDALFGPHMDVPTLRKGARKAAKKKANGSECIDSRHFSNVPGGGWFRYGGHVWQRADYQGDLAYLGVSGNGTRTKSLFAPDAMVGYIGNQPPAA